MHLDEFLTGELHLGDRHIRIVDGNNWVWTMPGSRQLAFSACFLMGKSDKDPLAHSKLCFFGCAVVALLVLSLRSLDARVSIAVSSAQGSSEGQLFSIVIQVCWVGRLRVAGGRLHPGNGNPHQMQEMKVFH